MIEIVECDSTTRRLEKISVLMFATEDRLRRQSTLLRNVDERVSERRSRHRRR